MIKIELELPYDINEELYWLYKEKIVKTSVSKYFSFNLGLSNDLRIDMKKPNESYSTESLTLDKVFKTKEELIKSISNE